MPKKSGKRNRKKSLDKGPYRLIKVVFLLATLAYIFLFIPGSTYSLPVDPLQKEYQTTTYEELLSSKTMYQFEKHMMHIMVDDFMWLALTTPKDPDDLTDQIMKLRYKIDGPGEGLKPPSETAMNGGDCEDMTLFVIIRLLQIHSLKMGFVMFTPAIIDKNHQGHICAVTETPEGSILVIDATVKKIRTLQKFLQIYKKTRFEYYRIHWFFEDNSQNKIMKIVK